MWGAGKSTLLNLILRNYKGKDGIICETINAWMFESYEDAKVAIMEALLQELEENMIQQNMEIIMNIPKDRILIESDGPYSRVNGKKYAPELLRSEYEIIARALNEPDLIEIVWNNFIKILTQ